MPTGSRKFCDRSTPYSRHRLLTSRRTPNCRFVTVSVSTPGRSHRRPSLQNCQPVQNSRNRLKAEVRQRLLCGYSISSIEPKGVGIADLVLAMRAPCSKAADVHMGLPLGVVPHRATALKLSFGWFDPYGSVADDASADRVAASRLARSSLQSFGSSSRSSRTETR